MEVLNREFCECFKLEVEIRETSALRYYFEPLRLGSDWMGLPRELL
jgi:hypothetical protein